MPRYNLFSKIVVLIVVMLLPIIGLYFYSNMTSTDVLRSELSKSTENQLVFFQNQVDTNVENLSLWPNLLIQDPDIASFQEIFLTSEYFNLDTISLVKRIQTKLGIQESSSNWKSSLYIYSPTLHRVVSVNDAKSYDEADLKKRIKWGWQVKKLAEGSFQFSWFTASSYSKYTDPANANTIIEVRFDSSSIQDMLDKFKSSGSSDPFYYNSELGLIYNRSSDQQLAQQLVNQLQLQEGESNSKLGSHTVKLNGQDYLVNMALSETTGWYLIDYTPLADILKPINQSNRLFYFSVGCLLLMSCLAAYLLYGQVQVPVKKLIVSFHKLRSGDYSVRLESKGKGASEFKFLFTRFNLMVAQIQELFEKVYVEQIRVREAKLKQLQSQINPHFFYNCFSFISSMAKLQDYRAVVAMSQNLAAYYRYTTRQERDVVPFAEELDFVHHYLDIQKLRMKRLEVTVQIADEMLDAGIPPLVLQPLVENAVIHGIESSAEAGSISITGESDGGSYKLTVEDDGIGMDAESILVLQYKLSKPMEEEMGCGLWNVHQRMQLQFGESAGLTLGTSAMGGFKVVLQWSDSAKVALLEAEARQQDTPSLDQEAGQ
ncbi:sensor histidine kinase [Paenibacillus sp. PR3]|uniref:Sensor histidine kinase n=1 Tax=Paenibacillus terricola TaxID=2763503 RepID=A0ABR8N362_9BACL|nr:histidine kinase [Paenibacillus terricola]MBD3922617.1 sensor histidine kinase [Paenibacillus terricola]